MDTRIIRVFPTKTHATPEDEFVRIRETPSLFDEADEVHISVTFTWDKPWAEWAARQWERVAPVKIGGPAYNEPGGEFVPGMYLKKGYVITSRGCPNRCWFCAVPKREGFKIRELPVRDGWIIQDDNLLACSPKHIDEVFSMLARQPYRPQFTGGLEAALLTPEMAVRLHDLRPNPCSLHTTRPTILIRCFQQERCCRMPDSAEIATRCDATSLSDIKETPSKRRRSEWGKRMRPDLCLSLCFTGIRMVIQTRNGVASKENGQTRLSFRATAKNILAKGQSNAFTYGSSEIESLLRVDSDQQNPKERGFVRNL